MANLVEKVTAFITRPTSSGHDLLLFRHPNAGVQVPAGTVEVGETPQAAVLREAVEETGLTALAVRAYLDQADDPPPAGHLILAAATPVFARPANDHFPWAHLRRSLAVKLNRRQAGFSQVTYEEWDRLPDPQYLTLQITGWVPDEVLATTRRRHFFHLEFQGQTAHAWTVHTDQHDFRLFWAPLAALPAIVEPQQGWLRFLAPHFPQVQLASGETPV